MSTIKSSAENLTLNADGANNDIKFQSNGSEVAQIDQAGVISSTGGSTHADNVKAQFGTGNDLQIYHDGSNSYIRDAGDGDIHIRSDAGFRVQNAGGTENYIYAESNGMVRLYHNNVTKLDTTATGVAVTGGVAIGGTGAANTLDDYEEGTFTAALGGASGTPANTTGYYTKIGRQVFVHWYSKAITISSASGSASITGLPFTASSASHAQWAFTYQHGNAVDGGSRGGYIQGNSTIMAFIDTNAVAESTYVNGSSKYMMVSGSYFTA
jgi:hypothetical protein